MRKISIQSWLTVIIAVTSLLGLLATNSTGSDAGEILGRYSVRYMLVIVAYAVIMSAAAVVLSLRLPVFPAWVSASAAVFGLVVVTWLPLLDHTWGLNYLLKISGLWLIFALLWRSGVTFTSLRHVQAILMVIGTLLFVVNVLSLVEFPAIQTIDEGWDANLGWTFVHEGVLYTRINQGVFGIPELFAPVGNILPAYWLLVVGLGLFQARSLILFGGLILLALTYATTYRIYHHRWVALISVLLLASSYAFFTTSHLFRLDLFIGLAGIAALYLFLRSTQRSWFALLAGFILSASIEFHQNALMLCVGAGFYLIVLIVLRSVGAHRLAVNRREIYFMLGGLAGGSLFLIFHVLPNPSEFLRQFSFSIGMHLATPPDWITSLGPLAFLVRGIINYSKESPFEPGLLIVLIIAAWRLKKARPYILLLLSLFAVYSLLSPSLSIGYFINFWPLTAVIGAGAFLYENQRRSVLAIAVLVAVALPVLAAVGKQETVQTNREMMIIATKIKDQLKPADRVVALHSYFLLIPHPPELIAPFMHTYSMLDGNPGDGAEIWDKLSPNVFILSPNLAEPADPITQAYRDQNHFIQVASYDQAGCCVIVYRRLP